MHIETHCNWSQAIGRDMEFNVYGHAGKPVLVIPSSGGSFHEYEDFGMVEACHSFLAAGKIQLFTVSSVDQESWLSQRPHAERSARHADYERYIIYEFTPYLRQRTQHSHFMVTGCSLGAFHTINFLLKYPGIFDTAIALSGVYDLEFSVGENMDGDLWYYSPLHYFANLNDDVTLDRLRRSQIVVCSGQGAWEEKTLHDTYALKAIFVAKKVPVWVDIWGPDVSHDWVWWRKQMPYFLEKLGYHTTNEAEEPKR